MRHLCPFEGCHGRDRHHILKASVCHPEATEAYEALREAVEYYFDPVRFLPGVESVAEKKMLDALRRLR